MISEIALNAHWHGINADRLPDEGINGFSVPDLAAFDPRLIDGKLVWLEREFDLPLQDVCITYELHVDAAPVGTHLTINGRDFGEIETPFVFDVTDMVTLEDNRIAFRVMHGASGRFGAVSMVAIPCE